MNAKKAKAGEVSAGLRGRDKGQSNLLIFILPDFWKFFNKE